MKSGYQLAQQIRTIFIWVLVIILFIMILLLLLQIGSFFNTRFGEVNKQRCFEYERAGVIPKNSCYCTEKIFKSWEESYDWKDSCEILDSMNQIERKKKI